MSTNACWNVSTHLFRAVVCGLVLAALSPAAAATQPVIRGIQPKSTNAVVTVDVPEGVQRVVLESRTRLSSGAWTPAAVQQTDGSGRSLTFTIPISAKMELLRVRADFSLPLPTKFYSKTNISYWGGPTNSSLPVSTGPSDGRDFNSPERTVEESDVWKIQGNRLYFFNNYRGLQVIDIADPDRAKVVGTYPLPAAGEDMYLLRGSNIVLIARQNCSYSGESQAIILSAIEPQPTPIAHVPIEGYVAESRLVGDVLYVASQQYRKAFQGTNEVWEWGTQIASIDLTTPDRPVTRGTLWYPGYGLTVSATDVFFFVATSSPTNWYKTSLRLVDITSPDGKMYDYATIENRGRLTDKFKIHYANGILTTVSEEAISGVGTTFTSWLETFSVADPRTDPPFTVRKLAALELARGERLFATRFDSNKAYIVTFQRIDPLWIVDLSDPSTPRISGELEVPGWSTYIHPMGDRLLSIGYETNRVAVSLFDVAQPSKPALLSRVLLGRSYSWSEAAYDEKAFSVLEQHGLIMVPYSGDEPDGWASNVQLIDLTSTNLTLRGVIQHRMQPRRATVHQERILSLSGLELLSLTATNRDQPAVTGTLPLAWSVDRLFLAGDFLLQATGEGDYWGKPGRTAVHVTLTEDPDTVLKTLELGPSRLAGAAFRSNLLYLVQSEEISVSNSLNLNLTLTIVDATALPELRLVGSATIETKSPIWSWGDWWPAWVGDDVIVWAGGGHGYWLYSLNDGPVGSLIGPWRWRGRNEGGGRLLAFKVGQPEKPTLVSDLDLTPTNTWRSYSLPFSVGPLLYLSHTGSELLPGTTNTWVERHYLDVVDYSDPTSPTLRKPLNIPGQLQAVERAGELLFTKGRIRDTNYWSSSERVHALAYDGVQIHSIAEMDLPQQWFSPVAFDETNVYLTRSTEPTGTNAVRSSLERWVLSDTGRFELNAFAPLNDRVYEVWADNSLILTLLNASVVEAFDGSRAGVLKHLKTIEKPGCLYLQLDKAVGALGEGVAIPLGSFGVLWEALGN